MTQANFVIIAIKSKFLDHGGLIRAYPIPLSAVLLPNATDSQLGHALRKWREGEGLKAYELAQKSGVSQSYVSEIENGKRRLNDETAERIARAFDLTLVEFESQLTPLAMAAATKFQLPEWLDTPSTPKDAPSDLRVRTQTPGLAGLTRVVPGMEALARHFVASLSKQQAAELVNRFMADYQGGDESGLAKANAILHILSESSKT